MVSKAHIVRSVFMLGGAQLVTWIGSAALTILLPRYLGDADLGKLTLALALTNLLGLVTDLGATSYLTKEVARQPERASELTWNLLLMRLPLCVLAAVISVVIAHTANYDEYTRQIVYVLTIGILITALSNMVIAALQGLHVIKVLAMCSMITKVGQAGISVLFLLLGGGAIWVAVAWVATSLVVLVLSTVVLLRHMRFTPRLNFKLWRPLLLAGLPFFVWQAALLIYGQIDTVLLAFLTQDVVVGWYAAAYRIVMIPVFIPTIVVTVIFPALSAASSDRPAFNEIARRAVHFVTLVTVPMALGIMLLPDKIIHLLNYPAGFDNSILPLAILAPHLPLAAIDVMIGTVLNTRDRQRRWAVTGIAAAILNPLLNLLVIPYTQTTFGNGAIGAATITTFTEAFMLVVGVCLLPRDVFGRETVSAVLKCVAAGLVMSAAVVFTRDMVIVVPIVVGGLVYTATCLAIGAVSMTDVQQIRMYLLQRRAVPQPS
jgi:O-antigen/teichoic acid export membrane protein